jgi:hypothetical protein
MSPDSEAEEAAMWWKKRPSDQPAPDGGLGAECEAWLAGSWAEYLAAQGEPVPRWAWLNQVAHASEKAIRSMTRLPAVCNDEWLRLRGCIAESLIKEAAAKGVSVAELQRSVLLPIECTLFQDENLYRFGNPELMVRILAALRHPSAQPGSR